MENIKMRVEKRRDLTPSIAEFTLVPVGGDVLPSFDPGAHITLETPSGAMRRYSLINDGSDPKEFVVAIKKEPNSRGGSASMHEQATVGSELTVEFP
ncbi:MAG: oxidoreductase, partial [Alphaproteobacteria bacterium]|nr:oxidoreductase [Alphaproteobacteria bacterium]